MFEMYFVTSDSINIIMVTRQLFQHPSSKGVQLDLFAFRLVLNPEPCPGWESRPSW